MCAIWPLACRNIKNVHLAGERSSNELILLALLVPQNLPALLIRKRGHVAGNSRLLADFGRRNHLFVAAYGLYPIAKMVDGAVALPEILGTVQVNGLPRLYAIRSLASEQLRGEIQIHAVEHLDSSLVAA